jgi:hypothetical protein
LQHPTFVRLSVSVNRLSGILLGPVKRFTEPVLSAIMAQHSMNFGNKDSGTRRPERSWDNLEVNIFEPSKA